MRINYHTFTRLACLALLLASACSPQTSTDANQLAFAESPNRNAQQQRDQNRQPGRDVRISFAAVGDIMLGSTFPAPALPPNDGADMLKEVTPLLSAADVAFGNLEGPMLEGGSSSKCGPRSTKCFAFRVPTRYGRHLKDAGFDVISLANNHAGDFGANGMESSARVLESLGIVHSGKSRSIADVAKLHVKGRRITVVAFAHNNISYNVNEIDVARQVVSQLAKETDILVVSFHGGAEGTANQHVPDRPEIYLGEQRGHLRRFAHTVVDAGADLVIGHGPHVVRGMEVYRDRLIAYSLGNFATYGKFNLTAELGLTLILEAEIDGDGKFTGGRVHPAKQVKPGGVQLDKAKQVIPVLRNLSQQDFAQTAVRVGDDGIISAPTNAGR